MLSSIVEKRNKERISNPRSILDCKQKLSLIRFKDKFYPLKKSSTFIKILLNISLDRKVAQIVPYNPIWSNSIQDHPLSKNFYRKAMIKKLTDSLRTDVMNN